MSATVAASPSFERRDCRSLPLGECPCAVPAVEMGCRSGCCEMRILGASASEPRPPACKPVMKPIDIGRPLPDAWLRCGSTRDCTTVRGGGCCWPMAVNRTHASHVTETLDAMACGVCQVTECEKDEPFECRQGQCRMVPTTRSR